MTWILLVTWVIPGQPPATSQAQFHSQQACAAARDDVLKSGQELRQQIWTDAGSDGDLQTVAKMSFPHVSAVCAAQ